jgi:hypothetical protein
MDGYYSKMKILLIGAWRSINILLFVCRGRSMVMMMIIRLEQNKNKNKDFISYDDSIHE